MSYWRTCIYSDQQTCSIKLLTLSILGNFSCFFVVCLFFSKSTFLKNSFRNTIRMANSLDPDQARHFIGPDLGPNCLQRLSADEANFSDMID